MAANNKESEGESLKRFNSQPRVGGCRSSMVEIIRLVKVSIHSHA
ncbi:hypothetical protein F544_8270 [Bibersteinia trehalosi USDA-ARS-USMARC-190]|uniref:Uncharacterized protein n=1 Tax=Bibersteinia trehalosi USDA-ARS-USMARC-190 TaxID=1263832 RepID=W0R9J0_BIBTR|nr:hypothetical protein F544_8270 [Bibersteinia trehalosi USDA-ARS-USMARC-190]